MPVIAALDDPFAAGTAGDDADVMPPHHHGADARPSGIAADRSPITGEPQTAVGYSEVIAEPPATPGARTAAPAGDASAPVPRKVCAAAMSGVVAHMMGHMRMVCAMREVMFTWTRMGVG